MVITSGVSILTLHLAQQSDILFIYIKQEHIHRGGVGRCGFAMARNPGYKCHLMFKCKIKVNANGLFSTLWTCCRKKYGAFKDGYCFNFA